MPEMRFRIQWPDGDEAVCYSPSTVIAEHFRVGEAMPLEAFVARSRVALGEASRRVARRHGFFCARAAAQLAELERAAAAKPPGDVTILSLE